MSEKKTGSWAPETGDEPTEEEGNEMPTIEEAVLYLAQTMAEGFDKIAAALRGEKYNRRTEEVSPPETEPTGPPRPPPYPTTTPQPVQRSIVSVEDMFPSELRQMLAFEEEGKFIVVRPRQYLGSELFAQVGKIARNLGGEYISMGRLSHFKIPRG